MIVDLCVDGGGENSSKKGFEGKIAVPRRREYVRRLLVALVDEHRYCRFRVKAQRQRANWRCERGFRQSELSERAG